MSRITFQAGEHQGRLIVRRQGDVLLEEIAEIPASARKHRGLVLASGEITGHCHRIEDKRTARLFSTDTSRGGELFLEVIGPDPKLVHPEHETIILPRGRYRVWKQREFDDSGARDVAD
jgi:hypothetical protein